MMSRIIIDHLITSFIHWCHASWQSSIKGIISAMNVLTILWSSAILVHLQSQKKHNLLNHPWSRYNRVVWASHYPQETRVPLSKTEDEKGHTVGVCSLILSYTDLGSLNVCDVYCVVVLVLSINVTASASNKGVSTFKSSINITLTNAFSFKYCNSHTQTSVCSFNGWSSSTEGKPSWFCYYLFIAFFWLLLTPVPASSTNQSFPPSMYQVYTMLV